LTGIKSNEREFNSQVITWLNEFIGSGTYPFEVATSDPSIKSYKETTRFPDVAIWLNREAKLSYCFWELKTPATAVDDKKLLDASVAKARRIKADYFVTWNMRDAVIWRTPLKGIDLTADYRLHNYPCLSSITKPDDLWDATQKELLKSRAKEILDELARLQKDKHLHKIQTDSTFFVARLRAAIQNIGPPIGNAIHSMMGKKSFRSGILKWARSQGMPTYDVSKELCEVIAGHLLYRLLGKIIFYLSLRRAVPDLPLLELKNIKNVNVGSRLQKYFEKARQIDYQAIFENDITDTIPIPDAAAISLKTLIIDLNRFNFSDMPQDVIGNVFEKLIPEDQRHTLGQYFTSENLVDLIISFCVLSNTDKVMDPTCGTGTFLIRAYDRLRNLGLTKHTELLPRLWGVDIGGFPAELATISLYKQNIGNYDNFPRILASDFFDIYLGQKVKFPPPKPTGDSSHKIDDEITQYDAIIGNFPYIRQELIEKTHKGYKEKISGIVIKEWAKIYPELLNGAKIKLSGQADIYAYMFFHSGSLLKEGGRMGIVTSNSWLDVAYGYELQRFFLRNFKIIAILESRCEPWFEDAAVNTVVTILERCSNRDKREVNNVKFVKIKSKLSSLIGYKLEKSAERWWRLDNLIHDIENCDDAYIETKNGKVVNNLEGHGIYETDDVLTRFIPQIDLLNDLEDTGKTTKWSRYLRAPELYFEILEKCKDNLISLKKLANVRRGITTGINDFFYLTDEKINHWKIEKEFIKPVIKSPRELTNISLQNAESVSKIFLCNKEKKELRKEGKIGALRYIQWGEKQKTKNGIYWKDVPTVEGRLLWYSLEKEPMALFLTPGFINKRFFIPESTVRVYSSDVFFEWWPQNMDYSKIIISQMNSSFIHLQMEVNGRANLGEGVLKIIGPELDNLLVINPVFIEEKEQSKLLGKYHEIVDRPILSIFEEVNKKDRQALDSAVLEAMGLDPDKYLKPLYSAFTELVSERIELAKMRKSIKKVRVHHDIKKLKEEIIADILLDPPKKFPEDFVDLKYLNDYDEISIPVNDIKLGPTFFGKQEIIGDNKFRMEFDDIDQAKYVVYAHRPNEYVARIPKDMVAVSKAIIKYEKYLNKLWDDTLSTLTDRVSDFKLAESLAAQVMDELGIPSPQRIPTGKSKK